MLITNILSEKHETPLTCYGMTVSGHFTEQDNNMIRKEIRSMKSKRSIYWLVAGIINLITAILHAIGGQIDLVNPMLQSNLENQVKAEWFSAWHMITIILFASSYLVLKNAFADFQKRQTELMKYIGILYILLSIPFCVSSIVHKLLVPQWILLLPIGVLVYLGVKK